MRKCFFLFLISFFFYKESKGQVVVTGSLTVNGDINTFYPVTFQDGMWGNDRPTELTLGRSSVHINSHWRGSLIANFKYHTTLWGNGSEFIDADIKSYPSAGSGAYQFIAGWQDVTWCNGDSKIIIWLKGGGTTYLYSANCTVSPVVYDGVSNSSTYSVTNCGTQFGPKIAPEAYVNNSGKTFSGPAYFNSAKPSYMLGSLGIGTTTPQNAIHILKNSADPVEATIQQAGSGTWARASLGLNTSGVVGAITTWAPSSVRANTMWLQTVNANDLILGTNDQERIRVSGISGNVAIGTANPGSYKLAVEGTIGARKIKVTQTSWADDVFKPNYTLPSLTSTKAFIQKNGHLPGIPAEKCVVGKDIDIADMQVKLLRKIEELTLYIIKQEDEIRKLKRSFLKRRNK